MARYIEIVYDDSTSMVESIDVHGSPIKKYIYAREVFKETILPGLNIQSNDIVTLRKLRTNGCFGTSTAVRLPNDELSILKFLEGINHNNGTPLYRTIKDSFDSFRNTNRDGIIVIITDGEDTCSEDISTVLPPELVDQINLGVTIVMIPFAIEEGEMLEKLKKVGRAIKAQITPIGGKTNQNREKNKEDFKKAVTSKRPIEPDDTIDASPEVHETDEEKLSYPLDHCYVYEEGGEIDWETLEILDFSFHNSLRLYHEDLLSWEPKRNKPINNTQFNELTFVYGIVFKTGIPLPLAKTMLSQLQKPYYYDNKCIYWDFTEACWKYFKNVKPSEKKSKMPSDENHSIQQDKVYEVISEGDVISFKQRAKGKNIMKARKVIKIGDYIEVKGKKRK